MSQPMAVRGRLAIIKELHSLTGEMAAHKDDAEFLILSVEKRQELMDEYDMLAAPEETDIPAQDQAEIKRLINEIMGMDNTISSALEKHRGQSKTELASSNTQQKILGYTNRAMSASGSYMDYKK